MSESEEPDWLAELARGGDVIRRQIEQLVQGAEQIVRAARQSKAGGPGPVPPFQHRLVRAVDAAMRELVPVRQPVNHQLTLATTVSADASLTTVTTITATGSIVLPPMSVSGQATVKDRPRGFAAFSDGEKAAFILIWLYAVWLPWFASRLPPELHQMLSDSITNYAFALAITWHMFDKHK
jgi:hypothetical protein